MQIQLINVAQKMPAWVDIACEEYQRRLPREIDLKIVTLPLTARKSKQSSDSMKKEEASRILQKVTAGSLNLALDERGADWSSQQWSGQLKRWMFENPQVNILIGGPDGLAEECLDICQHKVALGRMTMPHALVRVVIVEQLYRAWTILQGHPYHRE
ncbi:MAG: 23S rRNA (pseudouridine(1915)-N(3))-methyltransferase RlmH [Pseudomonadota bacterium]